MEFDPNGPISVIVEDTGNPDESPIFQHITTFKENGGNLISTFRNLPEADTPCKLLKGAIVKYRNLKFIGERRIDPLTNELSRSYYWMSYIEFYNKARRFAYSLINKYGLKPGDKVGIFSSNCPWWQITCYACFISSLVPVPIYDSLGANAACYIIVHSETSAIIVNKDKFETLKTLLESPIHDENIKDQVHKVKNVFVIGKFDQTTIQSQSNGSEIQVQSCESALITENKLNELSAKQSLQEPQPDDIAMIMYTSGSTGKPKGCLLTHRNIIAGATGLGCLGCSITPTDTYYSFLPLAHIYALGVEIIMVAQGASIGYFSGTVKNLLDDLSVLRPTIICGVPRVWNRIVDGMKTQISHLPSIVQTILNYAMKWKSHQFKNGKPFSLLLDTLLFRNFINALGGKVRLIVSGGAPILPDVYDFLTLTITPNIVSGYGLTEVAASVSVSEIPTPNALDVGAVSLTSQVKLRAVPGLSYNPRGSPMCGEILVRGPHVFKGYYKEEEMTKEVLDEDGWYATGDIGTITKDGSVQIIDRVKQLVKLSQGEYISLSTLTDIYGSTPGILNIYVYADSHQDSPLAVVIPKPELIEEWKKQGITDVTKSKEAQRDIIERFEKTAEKNSLRGFEKIKHVLIDTEEFTVANNLLTPSIKPKWQSLRMKYEASLLLLVQESQQ